MPKSWLEMIWELSLTLAVIMSTTVTILIFTLPSTYSHFHPGEITDEEFTEDDKKDAERSGYSYYLRRKPSNGRFVTDATVHVVVLGDIGRSPRMQYHALSIAAHGGRVNLVGYLESDVHPDVRASRLISIVPIAPLPKQLQARSKWLFLFFAPLKVLWQTWSLYHALGYRTKAAKWMLVQNPPSIPTLLVAQMICFFRNTRLVIDWHNFAYSILALRLGSKHPLVRIAQWYEGLCSRGAAAHFAVTKAMARVLKEKWGVEAMVLHDRPPKHFQPLAPELRSALLHRVPETAQFAENIEKKTWRLVVSSTSWTPDEDFSLLLAALVLYSDVVAQNARLPRILVIITGKGPQKEHYCKRIGLLNQEKRLQNVIVSTAWLSNEDYASLLGSADLGISLHTSSSGVDLPMKVVDMFGAGLPVVGWSKYEAWPELVQEGVNGLGFVSAEGLNEALQKLFGGNGRQLEQLRKGSLEECKRRWDDEWMPVAGKLFRLKP